MVARPIEFTRRIDLGHLVQAGLLVVTISAFGIGGYETVARQLDNQAAEVAQLKQRQAYDEASAADDRASQRSAVTETRQALSKISDQIADLRALVAGQADGHRR